MSEFAHGFSPEMEPAVSQTQVAELLVNARALVQEAARPFVAQMTLEGTIPFVANVSLPDDSGSRRRLDISLTPGRDHMGERLAMFDYYEEYGPQATPQVLSKQYRVYRARDDKLRLFATQLMDITADTRLLALDAAEAELNGHVDETMNAYRDHWFHEDVAAQAARVDYENTVGASTDEQLDYRDLLQILRSAGKQQA